MELSLEVDLDALCHLTRLHEASEVCLPCRPPADDKSDIFWLPC